MIQVGPAGPAWFGRRLRTALVVGLVGATAHAATFTVDRTDDPAGPQPCTAAADDCTLRGAITAANAAPGSTVVVPADTYVLTQTPSQIAITADTTITGDGAAVTIVDGGALGRIFEVGAGKTVSIAGLTLTNGRTAGSFAQGGAISSSAALTLTDCVVEASFSAASGGGGGIASLAPGSLTLVRTVVQGNRTEGGDGGGIFSSGTLTVTDSTVSENTAYANGGGIEVFSSAATITGSTLTRNECGQLGGGISVLGFGSNVTVAETTVSTNTSDSSGGGIAFGGASGALTLSGVTITDNQLVSRGRGGGLSSGASSSTLTIRNSIVAGNSDPLPDPAPDCDAAVGYELVSQGYNLIENPAHCGIGGDTTGNVLGQSALLAPLDDNGGPTMTHALLAGSPAVNAGNPAAAGSGGAACGAVDQRGVSRAQTGAERCDIGAFEAVPPPAATTTTTLAPPTTSTSSTSTTTTSSTATSTTTPASTTTTTLPAGCELLTGKKLLLKAKTGSERRAIGLLAPDPTITLGAGNATADDPTVAGGTVRVVARAGDGFDDTYTLDADRWRYVKKGGANKGYKLRPTSPFRAVVVQPGKRIKIVAKGTGLGHTLVADPETVDVVLAIGAHCYCLRFGDAAFKPDRKWLAKDAPRAASCPAPAP